MMQLLDQISDKDDLIKGLEDKLRDMDDKLNRKKKVSQQLYKNCYLLPVLIYHNQNLKHLMQYHICYLYLPVAVEHGLL